MSDAIAELWSEAAALQTRLDAGRFTEAEEGRLCNRMFALENATLVGPIRSRADALAKLYAAGLTFERGERTDGGDGPAFAEAMRWLEAH